MRGTRPTRMHRSFPALGLLTGAILWIAGAAGATVPSAYHSPADDGVPPTGPLEIEDGSSTTLH